MRIALLAPVALPVPPAGYGGTELVVAQLADGLVRRGHDVTLFASGDAHTAAALRARYPRALELEGVTDKPRYQVFEHAHVSWALSQASAFDVVHDHTKMWGVRHAAQAGAPVVTTVHNDFTLERRAIYGAYPDHPYVAISRAHAARMPELNFVDVVYNGLDLGPTAFRATKDDYFLFIGRLDDKKGAHLAARAAALADVPLVMAGRIEKERAFFEREVAPWLDGVRRRYVGEVTGAAKWDLYAGARALLFPIQWEEPFGLVMIEAMACGTPVIATRRGSVPEIVVPGETGLVLAPDADAAALAAALRAGAALDPRACRDRVAAHFSADAMVAGYERVYARLARGGRAIAA
jgi:glycosyltransferase involved in cell wall biosynthesis